MEGTVDIEALAPLKQRLESLDKFCLSDLQAGLEAMEAGDLTVEVRPRTPPLQPTGDPDLDAFIEVFNRMLTRAQTALSSYNRVREDLRAKLGDHSVIADLDERMRSMDDNCLVSLAEGLKAIKEGDFSADAVPVTRPLTSQSDASIGSLGETFNSMLAKAQAGLGLYNASRRALDTTADDLSTSLSALESALGSIAEGDLTVEPKIDFRSMSEGTAKGVYAAMLADAEAAIASYDRTRASLTRLVTEIQSTSATVASASQEMALTSEGTGRAVQEIAAAVGSVATGAEQQVRLVGEARDTAQRTAAEANRAKAVAQDGVLAAEDARAAMNSASEASASVGDAIGELARRSGEIGGIVQTITGIASQTNLLALNAAIEAARAGEQGRGFSVVADEVRKLAEESKRAAARIAELVKEIQAETNRTVTVAEEGSQRTAQAVEMVEHTRVAFGEIGQQVSQVTDLVAGIVDATNEVAAVAEQSSASTQQVSASTEQTSASSDEMAASANELASTAQQLEALAGTFKLVA